MTDDNISRAAVVEELTKLRDIWFGDVGRGALFTAIETIRSIPPSPVEGEGLMEALLLWSNTVEEFGIQSAEMVPHAERLRDTAYRHFAALSQTPGGEE